MRRVCIVYSIRSCKGTDYHTFLTIIYVTRILGDGVDKNVSQETASCGRQSADIEIL